MSDPKKVLVIIIGGLLFGIALANVEAQSPSPIPPLDPKQCVFANPGPAGTVQIECSYKLCFSDCALTTIGIARNFNGSCKSVAACQ